jgi:pyruvate formate lyase activating enzyme
MRDDVCAPGECGGHNENTYCPKCNSLLIDRVGFSVSAIKIKDGKCPECGEEIPMVGSGKK